MNIERLKDTLRRHEDTVLQVYDDATGKLLKKGDSIQGHPTIGIGRNLEVGITRGEAEHLFHRDVWNAADETALATSVFGELNNIRQEVLVNMVFNMGAPRFKTFKRMLAALNELDYDRAADEMLDSKWAKQVGPRAQELARKMRTGTQ